MKEKRIRDLQKVDDFLKRLTCDHQYWWGQDENGKDVYSCVFCGVIRP